MARTFALVACLVALIAQASAFMIAPGAVGAAATIRQGAAMSSFTGSSPVCEREATSDRSNLKMMVSRARRQSQREWSANKRRGAFFLLPSRSFRVRCVHACTSWG